MHINSYAHRWPYILSAWMSPVSALCLQNNEGANFGTLMPVHCLSGILCLQAVNFGTLMPGHCLSGAVSASCELPVHYCNSVWAVRCAAGCRMQDVSCIEGKLYLSIEGDVWLTSFYYYPCVHAQ